MYFKLHQTKIVWYKSQDLFFPIVLFDDEDEHQSEDKPEDNNDEEINKIEYGIFNQWIPINSINWQRLIKNQINDPNDVEIDNAENINQRSEKQ